MIAGTLAWLIGIVVLQLQPVLPSLLWCAGLPAALLLAWRCVPCRWLAIALAGFLWALLQAHWTLDRGLPLALEGVDVQLTGRVAGIPERDGERLRFLFDVERLEHRGRTYPSPGRVRLSWYHDAPEVASGEPWRLQARLKRPRGFANPGGFDYERWLFSQGIRATGYVRTQGVNAPLDAEGSVPTTIDRVRARGVEAMHRLLPEGTLRGVLVALALGYRADISNRQWQVLRRTGTSHLIAISGLHIGLVAGMLFLLVRALWARWQAAALRFAAPRAAACAAILGAFGYAALAGFSIPTQRALIMVTVVMGAVVFARALRPARTLFVALALILLWEPAAVLTAGFWLSFAAVGVILWVVLGERGRTARWSRWVRVQGAVSVGLFPLLTLAFGQVSLVAPLANLLAIPWVGFVVVPTTLTGVVLLPVSERAAALLFGLAHGALTWLWWLLEQLAALPVALWQRPEPPLWTVLFAGAGVLALLLPRGVPLRLMGVVMLLPVTLVTAHPGAPKDGFRLTLLDVGQGLSLVVRTQHHTLVYDTGPRFGSGFDAGAAVVVPYLRALGVTRVDRLLVSHGDSDHSGGVASILAALPVDDVKRAPEPGELLRSDHCQAGQRWVWDGVLFTVLQPGAGYDGYSEENDHSCVLRISAGDHAVLLTGDIERVAEARLVHAHPHLLQADLVVIPHHGSTTSSSPAFVAAVRPTWAWVSTGYANRWGFPKPEVVRRYRASGARVWNSAQFGALEISVDPRHGLSAPRRWRLASHRYWSAAFGGQVKSSTIAPLVSHHRETTP